MTYEYGYVSKSQRAGRPVQKPNGCFETENPEPMISNIVRNTDTKFGVGMDLHGELGELTNEGKLYGISTFDIFQSFKPIDPLYPRYGNIDYIPANKRIGVLTKGAIWVNIVGGVLNGGDPVGINSYGEFGHTILEGFEKISNVSVNIGNAKPGSRALILIV